MSDSSALGLFPLNAVLFPAAKLPLHIFEERYKQLINGCEKDGTEFGVNLIESSKMHDIGCSARVVEVVTRYTDGRLDVIVEGVRRYCVGPVDEDSHPFLVSTVKWLDDDQATADPVQTGRTLELYNELIRIVYGGMVPELDEPGDAHLSFQMAQKAGLDLLQRQSLLSLDSEQERLQFLESYLQEVLPKVREADRIQGIIRNDGYL